MKDRPETTAEGLGFDPADPDKNKAYTTAEVADMFSVTNETVRDWIKNGKLKAVRIPSSQYRVLRADLMLFASTRYENTEAKSGGGDPELV